MTLLTSEKPRWHKALDNLKQFASLQGRLESELADAHRELSQLRGDYLQLGLRCSALASERDELRRRVAETEQYVEALHVESDVAGPAQFDAGEELHERLASLQEHLEQAQRGYGQLETQLAARGQKIESLQDRIATIQVRETELATELQQTQQRLDSVERDNAASDEKYRASLAELDSLRTSASDVAIRQHQQIDELQRRLDESTTVRAELERTGQARNQQLEMLRGELLEVRAKLAEVQTGYRDLEIAIADRDQELGMLEDRLSEHRTREVELDAQYTELARRYSAAEREHAAASDSSHQQLEALQRRIAALLLDYDTTRQANQTLQTALAEATNDVEHSRTQISGLEQKLGEAAGENESLKVNLFQIESERKQLLSRESGLVESLADTRHQLYSEKYAGEALVLARRRERWILWAALLTALALLAGVLLKQGEPLRDSPIQSPDVSDAQPGNLGVMPELADDRHTVIEIDESDPPANENTTAANENTTAADAEPLAQAYLMGNGAVNSDPESGCAQWGIAAGDCQSFDTGSVNESVIHLDSGVKYKVVSSGTGEAPRPGDSVVIKYRGMLLDGTEFDNSESRGGAVTLDVNELIPGLREALQRMEAGARWVVYVPAELGDPEFGGPGGQAVVFNIELMSVQEQGTGFR